LKCLIVNQQFCRFIDTNDNMNVFFWFTISFDIFHVKTFNIENFHCFDKRFFELFDKCFFFNDKTLFIKKYSLKSLNANDRSKKILINFVVVFFKVDKFNQYLIHVLNRNIRQNHIKTFQQRATTSHFAFQSTIIHDFHLFNQNCRTKSAHFNVAKMIKIDSLSQ
jgi:hypothetical protein